MLASVHVADVGPRVAVEIIRKPPRPADVPGLRDADVAVSAPLSASVLPPPTFGRVGFVAFWADEASLDEFLGHHPVAARLAEGWHVRLAPLRAYGSWPGLPDDVPSARATDAIAEDRAKPFHHQSAFVRFRPYGSEGASTGRTRWPRLGWRRRARTEGDA